MKVAADIQNAIQCYHVISDERKKKSYYSDITASFFFKQVDRTESSKEPEPVPLMWDMSEITACPPSPITDDPSAVPSPIIP